MTATLNPLGGGTEHTACRTVPRWPGSARSQQCN